MAHEPDWHDLGGCLPPNSGPPAFYFMEKPRSNSSTSHTPRSLSPLYIHSTALLYVSQRSCDAFVSYLGNKAELIPKTTAVTSLRRWLRVAKSCLWRCNIRQIQSCLSCLCGRISKKLYIRKSDITHSFVQTFLVIFSQDSYATYALSSPNSTVLPKQRDQE